MGRRANLISKTRANLETAASGANSDITSLSPSGNLILSPMGNVGMGTSTSGQYFAVTEMIHVATGIKFLDGTV